MEIVALEEKYGNFYAPDFEILIDEKNIVTENHVEIVSVSVDNTLDGADTFTFTVNNAFDIIKSKVLWLDDLFKLGERVEIKMGYPNRTNGLMTMIIGLITSIKVNFPSSGAPQMEVSGFDLSFQLMKNKQTRTFTNLTDSVIAENIANSFDLSFPLMKNKQTRTFTNLLDSVIAENIANENEYKLITSRYSEDNPDGSVHDSVITYEQTVKQGTESDFEFLQRLAERNYFEFSVFRYTLYFRKPAVDDPVIVTLEWGKSLVSFSPENSITEYVTEVDVKGRNTKNNKDILGKAESRLRQEQEKDIAYSTINFRIENMNATVETPDQAKGLAEATLKKLNEGLLKGSGESIGIPEILAGKNIELKGLGRKFSKIYYIEKTNHSISNSGYRTTFSVKDMSKVTELDIKSTGEEVDSTIPETETEEPVQRKLPEYNKPDRSGTPQ